MQVVKIIGVAKAIALEAARGRDVEMTNETRIASDGVLGAVRMLVHGAGAGMLAHTLKVAAPMAEATAKPHGMGRMRGGRSIEETNVMALTRTAGGLRDTC